jgi:hypothetical protein
MHLSPFTSGFSRLLNRLRSWPLGQRTARRKALQAWRHLLLAAAICLLSLSPSFGQDAFTLNLDAVSRGTTITVSSASPQSAISEKNLVLTLLGANGNKKDVKVSRNVSDEQRKAFEFIVPNDLDLGEYRATISVLAEGDASASPVQTVPVLISGSASKRLVVSSELGELVPKIDSVSPRVIFPGKGGGYSFQVIGSGFSPVGPDNHLIISHGNGNKGYDPWPEIELCWNNHPCKITPEPSPPDGSKNTPEPPPPSIGIVQSSRQLNFENIKIGHYGDIAVQIRVGDKVSDPPYVIKLSRVGPWWPLGIAVFVAAVVVGVVYRVGMKVLKKDNHAALLLDQDKNNNSLTRFQFYLWTLTAVFSYVFLFVSLNLVQGRLEFVDVPDGLPGIVLISASTTVFALGISNAKGSKGSGQVDPGFADFFSSGGYIVPERLQFFVWTILGVGVYLVVVLCQNPAEIKVLPTIPDGFLQLSGISSLGYLGGKLARKPGPTITSIFNVSYDSVRQVLMLDVQGTNLSEDATFKIEKSGGQTLRSPQDVSIKACIKTKQSDATDPKLASVLSLEIASPQNDWPTIKQPAGKEDPYDLTIYNPDGQFAAWNFTGIA